MFGKRKRQARGTRRHKATLAARVFTSVAGFFLMVYGFIAAFSPLPLGGPLVIIGFFMIAAANPAVRPVIVRMRRRWRWFNKLVLMIAPRTKGSVRKVMEETNPEMQAGETNNADTEQC